jgi:dTDP-4-dehydrorhamnose 3,5-epimerase
MEIEEGGIPGILIIKPKVFEDSRGSFFETYNKESLKFKVQSLKLDGILGELEFVQDNQSISNKDVLRGLHFQNPPYEQGKLLRVVKGSVMDIAVDLRKELSSKFQVSSSKLTSKNMKHETRKMKHITNPYYGKCFSIVLSDKNNLTLWIPPGFAHGFLTLEDNTIFIYKCTKSYHKESEGAIIWNDPDLNIDWGDSSLKLKTNFIVSEKDQNALRFKDFDSKF